MKTGLFRRIRPVQQRRETEVAAFPMGADKIPKRAGVRREGGLGMKEKQDLVNRYVYDVARRLPREQREELEREIRGLIGDMLEAEPEGDAEAVLRKLGPPAELARKYRGGERCLIGPEYFDAFLTVVKIVLSAVALGVLVSALVEAVTELGSGQFFVPLLRRIGWGVSALAAAFGFVTLVFAVLERLRVKLGSDGGEWSPSSLPPVPEARGIIKRGDEIVGIAFLLIFGGLLVFAPRLFSAWLLQKGQLRSIALLNLDSWGTLLPVILAGLGLGLAEGIVKLAAGRYTPAVCAVNAATGIGSLALAAIALQALPLWNPSFMTELAAALEEPLPGWLAQAWESGLISDLLLGVIVLGTAADIGVTLYRTLRYAGR